MYEHEHLQAFTDEIKKMVGSFSICSWAVERMIAVFENQIRLLGSVRQTLELLLQTNLYKIEKGESPLERELLSTVPSINARKVYINSNDKSTDYSTNISVD